MFSFAPAAALATWLQLSIVLVAGLLWLTRPLTQKPLLKIVERLAVLIIIRENPGIRQTEVCEALGIQMRIPCKMISDSGYREHVGEEGDHDELEWLIMLPWKITKQRSQ